MILLILATVVCAFWWLAEFIHESTQEKRRAHTRDKYSSFAWDLSHFAAIIGIVIGFRSNRFSLSPTSLTQIAGFAAMLLGILIRWIAIHTLGRFFTGKVSILKNHELVQSGPYKYIRHPAYTGTLIAYLGFGFVFKNWISFILIFVPVVLAALYRMSIEEKALREYFGEKYTRYAAGVKRLIPGVY